MAFIANRTALVSKKLPLALIVLAICSLGILSNIGACSNEFLFDDNLIIKNNPLVQGELSIPKIFVSNYWHQASEKDPLYRPITILSFAIQNSLSPISSFSVMTLNLLLYCAIAIVLLLLLLRISFPTKLCVIASLIFVTMPQHVEVVANGVGRGELLATFFSLLAMERYLALVRGLSISGETKVAKPRIGLILATTLYFLGLLSKESAVSTPVILFLIDQMFCVQGTIRQRLSDISYYLFLLIAIGVYFLIRNTVVGLSTPLPHELLRNITSSERIALASKTILQYLQQAIIPNKLLADYHDFRILKPPSIAETSSLLAILALISLSISSLMAAFDRKYLPSFCFAWFFIALLPTSNLLIPIGVIKADRLAFFPSIGVAIFIAWLLYSLINRAQLAGLIALAGFLLLQSVSTINYTTRWRNKETLWSHVVQHNPGSADAWRNVGDTYYANSKFNSAIKAYSESKRLRAQHGIFDRAATLLLAKTYHRMGEREKAAEYHLEVLRRNPNHVVAAISLGQLYLEEPKFYRDALRVFRFAVTRHPNNPHPLAHEAEALKRLSKLDEAEVQIKKALEMGEQWPYMLHIYAAILEAKGENVKARGIRARAAKIK